MTYELIVLGRVLPARLRELPLLALEAPALHLLVRHELDRPVAHADERERRAAVEPRQPFRFVYGRQPICRRTRASG